MDILFLIGRILFGGFFLMNGFNHLAKAEFMSQYAASKGVPAAKAMVYLSGLMILLGGLGVIFGVYTEIALWLIIIFLLAVSFKMHNFWTVSEPMAKMTEQINFMKNLALAGAALMMLFLETPWVWDLNLTF